MSWQRWPQQRNLVVAVALVASFLVGCADDEEPAADTTTPTTVADTTTPTTAPDTATVPVQTTTTTSVTPAPTTTTATEAVSSLSVNVYWSWTVPTSYGTPERLGAGGRIVTVSDTGSNYVADLAESAIEELLAGPDEVESEIGMFTNIPDGTELVGVDVADGTATVDLSPEFTEPGGTLGESSRLAQLVFTLTSIDSIESVLIAIDGTLTDPVLSQGFVVGAGFERDNFEYVRPFILVESPTPGEAVTAGTVVVRGESNTFEANIRWEFVNAEGLIVDEGFTTATGGMGTWGDFEFEVDTEPLSGQLAAVIVFESSPEDGSARNVVEVPIEVS